MKRVYVYLEIGVLFVYWSSAIALGQTEKTQPGSQNSEVVRLEDLIRLALERSPELAAAKRAVDVAHSRVEPAGALPDPELMGSPRSSLSRASARCEEKSPRSMPRRRSLGSRSPGCASSAT